MKYGLLDGQLKIIERTLVVHPEIEQAVLFGSRAINTFKTASDIDIALKGKKVSNTLAGSLKGYFEEETNLPYFVDVLSYPHIDSKNLKKHIDQHGIIIYRKGWRTVKLGNLIDVKHGYAFKGKSITSKPTNNILVTPGNFRIGGGFKSSKLKYFKGDVPNSYILTENNLIITMTDLSKESDTLGYATKIPKKEKNEIYLHNQRIGLVQFRSKKINKDFIYWLMRTYNYHWFVVSSASGTSVRHTSPERIKDYEFSLPPLPEQKAIAEVLSSLDDKIKLLHEQNKTLENIAQTLFRQWFIEDAKPNWQEKPLDEIADYLNGLACQKYPPKNNADKLPVLKIKELKDGVTDNSDWSTSEVDDKYIIKLGDIIFSWSGSLLIKVWDGQECILNQHLFKITSKHYPKWFYYFWTKYYMKEFVKIAESKATTMGHIKRKDLSHSITLAPPKDELSKMNKLMNPQFEKIILNLISISKLEKLRNILLPKLITGQVGIKCLH